MILFSRKKNQEKQNILRAPKKPNYEFKTYQLPSGYRGSTKRLGKDVLIPLSPETNTSLSTRSSGLREEIQLYRAQYYDRRSS